MLVVPWTAGAALVGSWTTYYPDFNPQGGGHTCSVPGIVDEGGDNQVKLTSFSSLFSCVEFDRAPLRPTLFYFSTARYSGTFSFDWAARVDYVDPQMQVDIGYGNVPGDVVLVSDYALAFQGTSGHVSAEVVQGDFIKFYLQIPDWNSGAAFLAISNFVGPGGETIQVPEPGTPVLALIGIATLIVFRSRASNGLRHASLQAAVEQLGRRSKRFGVSAR